MSKQRIASIDLLRGLVMIIMALDHVRGYFHKDAFLYDPLDLHQTSPFLFFTRWITHYCAPIFVLLAGISARMYGVRKSASQLRFFLFTRGLWLVFAELFIVTTAWTFNLRFPVFNLQVIWATGVAMIFLSLVAALPVRWILVMGVLLVAGHNLLDGTHFNGIFWSMLHEPGDFALGGGGFRLMVHYPVLPWIGIMLMGYCIGVWYEPGYPPEQRRGRLIAFGVFAGMLFFLLRAGNIYGDASHWSVQGDAVYSLLSFFNTTKYPPSLLYILMTTGPALLFLSMTEVALGRWGQRICIFGRVPMFYYLAHLYLIHIMALFAVVISGHPVSDMILSDRVSRTPALRGYGFALTTVYGVWIILVLILYPMCKWFDRYKRMNVGRFWWLSYF